MTENLRVEFIVSLVESRLNTKEQKNYYPRKISWARNDSARYWFHSALKKS